MAGSYEVHIDLPSDLVITFLSIYPSKLKMYVHGKVYV